MTSAITFDFHNTLVACDPWFQLEVKTLCRAFLLWRTGGEADAALLDEADRRYRQLRQAIIAHGHELTAEESVAVVLDQLDLAHAPMELEAGVREIMMATLADARPLDGALELVSELAAAGFPLAIVSSAVYHPFLAASLDKFGFAEHFQSVVTSASSGFYKSRPEIFWTALRDVGAVAERSLHVGDSYAYDVLGAQRAGLATAWLSSDPEAHQKQPAADLVIERLYDAAAAIIAAVPNRRS